MLLVVKNLRVEYAHQKRFFTAVNNISFDLARGESLAIIGESGSGKSALALAITGQHLPAQQARTTGTVRWQQGEKEIDLLGGALVGKGALRRLGISAVFQDGRAAMNPVLSVEHQLSEAITGRLWAATGVQKAEVLAMLNEVELPEAEILALKFPHQLSGGQVQRVALAMALAAKPWLLVADEPTAALDERGQASISLLLNRLQQQRGMSLLFITHSLRQAAALAHQTMVLFAGNAVEKGPTEKLLSEATHPYTKGLVACVPPAFGRYYFLPTTRDFMRVSASGRELETTASAEAVLERLRMDDAAIVKARAARTQSPVILEVRGLAHRYFQPRKNATEVLRDVNFVVRAGECVALIGESGSGKTTVARCVAGLLKVQQGQVLHHTPLGTLVNAKARLLSSAVNFVFQDTAASFDPLMRLEQSIGLPLLATGKYSRRQIAQRVAELAESVSLTPDALKKLPDEVSGGQKQRAVIARALALNPSLLVLDEPLSALDVSTQAHIMNLLNELKHTRRLGYLFISHQMATVRHMADSVVMLHDGVLVENADAEHFFERPSHPKASELVKFFLTQQLPHQPFM